MRALFRGEIVLTVEIFLHVVIADFSYLLCSRSGCRMRDVDSLTLRCSWIIRKMILGRLSLQLSSLVTASSDFYQHLNALHVDRSSYMHGFIHEKGLVLK